jgi:hypothetical protein
MIQKYCLKYQFYFSEQGRVADSVPSPLTPAIRGAARRERVRVDFVQLAEPPVNPRPLCIYNGIK